MAAYDYSKLLVTATALIARFGTAGCRLTRAASTPDSDKPWKAEPAADQVVASGLSAVGDGIRLGFDKAAGTSLATLSGKAYLAAAVAVQPGDRLEVPDGSADGWVRYAISAAEPINPGGTRLLWVLTLGD